MDMHQDGHDLTRIQLPASASLSRATCQQFTLQLGKKLLAEIIDVTEQFEYTHPGMTFGWVWSP